MAYENTLVGGLQQVIGIPNNFAGEIVLYTVGATLFVLMVVIVTLALFRRW